MQVSGIKGRYRLGAVLGTGGMATVHRAVTVGSGVPVAVKLLHPHLVHDRSIAKAFREEARLAQALDHPSIVRVVDLSAEGDPPALVMDLIDGGSLLELEYGSWNRGDRVPPAVASAVVLGVLAALERAHEARDPEGELSPVVHRDVSPHNVLVGKDGVARLADFGIARVGDETGSTMTGKVKGKLAYMAPEQFSGKRASERSDIYGAGVILWELLASERLFEGELAELVGKAINTDRKSLSLGQRGVSGEVDAIVLRALATEPTDRWSAAAVMADALRTALPPATRDEVAAWVESVAVKVPDGPLSSADPPPSSRVETTRKPRTTPPHAGLTRRVALPLASLALLVSGVLAWALSRGTPIAPEATIATGEAPPVEVVSLPSAVAPFSTEPTTTATGSVQASASVSAAPKLRGAPFDKKEAQRANAAYYNAKPGCPSLGGVEVVFNPSGKIDIFPAFQGECVAAKMRVALGKGKPFAGPPEGFLFGLAGRPKAALTTEFGPSATAEAPPAPAASP